MIKKASDCSVKIFMECMFNENLNALLLPGVAATEAELRESWQSIYMEYIDLSGIALSTELNLLKTIEGLRCRITLMQLYVSLHKECLRMVGQPFFPAFKGMKKYGHALWWDHKHPDAKKFMERLDNVVSKEKRYEMELTSKMQELTKYQESIQNQTAEPSLGRKEFIRQLNQLQKHGFVIDRDKTTVEDLALMVLDYSQALEASAHSKT